MQLNEASELSDEQRELIAVLMIFVTLKQLSGYSKMWLLGYITLSVLIVTITLIALLTLIFYFFYVALR